MVDASQVIRLDQVVKLVYFFTSERSQPHNYGEVQEWLNWPLSKSGKAQAFEGSNPSLSARRGALKHLLGRFSFCEVKGFGSQVRCSKAEKHEVRYPSLSATSTRTIAPKNFSDQVAKIVSGLSLCLLFHLANPLAKWAEHSPFSEREGSVFRFGGAKRESTKCAIPSLPQAITRAFIAVVY